MNSMKKIILASASPRRGDILRQIGVSFEVEIPTLTREHSDEVIPEEIVKDLARQKAQSVSENYVDRDDVLIIAADTIVVYNQKIFGKPANEEQAYHMLKTLQGRVHQVYTGVTLLYQLTEGWRMDSFSVETKVEMSQMNDSEIWSYINTREPMDKAGSYGIQGAGSLYIKRIDGEYNNVVGLPVAAIREHLVKLQLKL
ncbi:MAG: septum formation protein Maf [Clostridia bacterium]|nr:septum formation protein Maf [Clostridia bacterium]